MTKPRKQKKALSKAGNAQRMPGRPASMRTELEQAIMANPADLDAALALAELYNNGGEPARIVDLLSPFEAQYPFDNQFSRGNYNRLLGFGYAHSGRFLDAERMILRGLQDYPDSLDFLYAHCYVKLSLRESSEAIAAGEKYLNAYERLGTETLGNQVFNGMADHVSHLFNFLGTAWMDQGQLSSAEAYFAKSIETDDSNHLPYLNLASLHIRSEQWDQAKEVICRGLKRCQQVQELRMLAESLKKKATISACLMVKNEEELLPGCLDSIRDWVDEIIIVDTGSSDRTIEIARSYGAKIFEHPWEGSFSKSRNYTLQYATKDWVFIIDADERVYQEDIEQVLKAANLPTADVVTVNVYNVYQEHENTVVFLPSHRFIRREINPRYEGIVHNQLVLPENARYVRSGVRIKHLGYGLSPEKMKLKAQRTRALLEQQLRENPNNAFALFNYAQLLRSSPEGFQREDAPLILDAASRAIKLTTPDDAAGRHIHLMCLDQLAWTHYFLGEYEKALEYSERALAAKPGYLDPLLLRGYIYFHLNELEQASQHFERYLKAQAAYDPSKELENIILIHLNSQADAHFNLGAIAELSGDMEKARKHYRDSLAINERYQGANLNLGRLYLQEGNLHGAEVCFRQLFESNRATEPSLIGLAQIYREWKDYTKAEQVLNKLMETNPASHDALTGLSDLYLASGRYDDAIRLLELATADAPDDSALIAKLGDTLTRVGQFDQAIETYRRAEKHAPLPATLLNDLANCYYRTKEYAAAERYYSRALEADSELLTATRNLGLTKAQLGKTDEALVLLQQFLEQSPNQYELEHIVADLFVKQGDHQAALSHYEKYLHQRPSDPGAIFRLSECYLKLGHRDSAVLGYRRAIQLDPLCRPAQERLAELALASQIH